MAVISLSICLSVFSQENKNGWFANLQTQTGDSIRLYLISNISVAYTKQFNNVAKAAGPLTKSDDEIFKVAELYKAPEKDSIETVVLVNFPNGDGSWSKALSWGVKNNLRITDPHLVFAIAEKFPKLNWKPPFGSWTYLIETTGCTFNESRQMCCVLFNGLDRASLLLYQKAGQKNTWFAFRK